MGSPAVRGYRWVAPPGWPPPPPGWAPPPGWHPDPSWPAPPPGWQWWVAEQPPPLPPAPTPPRDEAAAAHIRRELFVVAAVVWLPWVVAAVIGLLEGIAHITPNPLPTVITGHQALSAVALSLAEAVNLVAVVLLWFVLNVTGESWRDIGLVRFRPSDFGWSLLLMGAIWGITAATILLLSALGLPDYTYGKAVHVAAYFLVPGWIASITAGVTEELSVNGYLMHRLEQLRVAPGRARVVSATIRMSYHLYYGFGALSMFFVGLLFSWRWQRTRRLWRLVVAHALYDGVIFTLAVLVH